MRCLTQLALSLAPGPAPRSCVLRAECVSLLVRSPISLDAAVPCLSRSAHARGLEVEPGALLAWPPSRVDRFHSHEPGDLSFASRVRKDRSTHRRVVMRCRRWARAQEEVGIDRETSPEAAHQCAREHDDLAMAAL